MFLSEREAATDMFDRDLAMAARLGAPVIGVTLDGSAIRPDRLFFFSIHSLIDAREEDCRFRLGSAMDATSRPSTADRLAATNVTAHNSWFSEEPIPAPSKGRGLLAWAVLAFCWGLRG